MKEKSNQDMKSEIQELRARLEEAQETLDAIRRGEVDGLVVSTPKGEQVYTITGAERPYRALIEDMREGAAMLSDDNTVLYCNSGLAKILKRPMEKIVGVNVESLVCPTHIKTFKGQLFLARTHKGSITKEITLQAKDDALVPTLISVNSLKSDTLSNTFLVVTDLTQHMEEEVKRYTNKLEVEILDRKKAEEALKFSEEKANDLIRYAPTGIYEIDYRVPKFKSVNDAMCQILGYTREELLSMSPFALLDDESKVHFKNRIGKLLAGEEVDETVEYKVIPKDGHEIYAVLNVMFTYKDGKPEGALVVAHDVTERRKMQKKVEEYAKNLESLVEERTKQLKDSERLAAIGATAGMVGHDIRNPLQAITSDVYLAKTDLASMPESEEKRDLQESLEGIEKNISYINKIVADLQDFARPLDPKIEEMNFEQMIHSVLAQLDVPENVFVTYSVAKDFPSLKTDKSYLQRILTNLANNSIQAMPNGGKLIIAAATKKGKAVITVEDNGEGIPESVREKLFTPLVSTKAKGQGFGLSVVKRFTERLGGTVAFESEVGKGAKFTIELPI